MKGTVKSIDDSVEWMQNVADWTAKASERGSICRRIMAIFRGPAFFDIAEGAVQCIEKGVVKHCLEEQLRVSQLVYVLNLIQTLRQQFLQWPKRFNMDREGDLAAWHDMSVGKRSYPEENDWEKRLRRIVQHLLLKYVEIFRQGTDRVGDAAMTCERIYSNGRFNDELVGEIRARMDESADFDPLHCSVSQSPRRLGRTNSGASSITLVELAAAAP
jgi:hypothetical protein